MAIHMGGRRLGSWLLITPASLPVFPTTVDDSSVLEPGVLLHGRPHFLSSTVVAGLSRVHVKCHQVLAGRASPMYLLLFCHSVLTPSPPYIVAGPTPLKNTISWILKPCTLERFFRVSSASLQSFPPKEAICLLWSLIFSKKQYMFCYSLEMKLFFQNEGNRIPLGPQTSSRLHHLNACVLCLTESARWESCSLPQCSWLCPSEHLTGILEMFCGLPFFLTAVIII